MGKCLFDADMLVFLDENGFVSWHVTYLHVQWYRVKIYFCFWKCWSPAKEIPQILRINYFDDIADFCPEIGQFDDQKNCCLKTCLSKHEMLLKFFVKSFWTIFLRKFVNLFRLMCKVQWVFVPLAFSILQYKSLGLTEFLLLFSLLLWFYTWIIGAAGYINLVLSYLRMFNTWKHNLWHDKMQIL